MNSPKRIAVLLSAVSAVLAVASSPGLSPAAGLDSASALTSLPTPVLHRVHRLPLPQRAERVLSWSAPGLGEHAIDDFESASWPDGERWVALLDLGSPESPLYAPAARDCRASQGSRALWSAGGGSLGESLSCGSAAPADRQTSALLALDLASIGQAASAHLLFDVWADAGPTEGLLLNILAFDGTGTPTERHIVYSATGSSSDWSRRVTVDLTRLVDRLDPGWVADLRGQLAYVEFLFLEDGTNVAGQGMFVDNLALEASGPAPIVVTPAPSATPAEIERTQACSTEPDCKTLMVSAYVDARCDRRFRSGQDYRVTSRPRIDIEAGGERLGTRLDARGYATFRLLTGGGATVTLAVPEGLAFCANAVHPVVLDPDDFAAYGLTRLELRLQRQP